MNNNDTLLIGVDFTDERDVSVLIVGRKPAGKPIEVVKALQGKVAENLYLALTASDEDRNCDKCKYSKLSMCQACSFCNHIGLGVHDMWEPKEQEEMV